jgi:hypothetical protein
MKECANIRHTDVRMFAAEARLPSITLDLTSLAKIACSALIVIRMLTLLARSVGRYMPRNIFPMNPLSC